MPNLSNRGNLILGLAVGALVVGVVIFFFVPRNNVLNLADLQPAPAAGTDCAVKSQDVTVQGSSLGSLVTDGTKGKIAANYYACSTVARNDIVAYRYAGNVDPVLKVVKGLPGDTFDLQSVKGGGWHILINDSVVKNSQGVPYLVDDQGYRMLSLYVHDYHGIIPQNAYLILGDIPTGTLDSTHFGLVGRTDLVGKFTQ